jgi:hypothetical protein
MKIYAGMMFTKLSDMQPTYPNHLIQVELPCSSEPTELTALDGNHDLNVGDIVVQEPVTPLEQLDKIS